MRELAIEVKGLSKNFGEKQVVSGIDLTILKGQVWGFLGPNGSGKTTTIRMICGLLTPSEGTGSCLGLDIVKQAKQIKQLTGYMTQKFSFWDDLTIRENLEFVARVYDLPDRRKAVDQVLKSIGLEQRQHQLAQTLSGGWKQRLALAAVTMPKPKLLLLDEPTAGVDPQARREFWDEIHRLASTGVTVLVSTHYMDEALRCDQVVYLANGKLITQGSVSSLIQHSSLVAYTVKGDDVRALMPLLAKKDAINSVAFFGSALHLTGDDEQAMLAVLNNVTMQGVHWERVEPSLEDVFIHLTKQAGVDQRVYE